MSQFESAKSVSTSTLRRCNCVVCKVGTEDRRPLRRVYRIYQIPNQMTHRTDGGHSEFKLKTLIADFLKRTGAAHRPYLMIAWTDIPTQKCVLVINRFGCLFLSFAWRLSSPLPALQCAKVARESVPSASEYLPHCEDVRHDRQRSLLQAVGRPPPAPLPTSPSAQWAASFGFSSVSGASSSGVLWGAFASGVSASASSSSVASF